MVVVFFRAASQANVQDSAGHHLQGATHPHARMDNSRPASAAGFSSISRRNHSAPAAREVFRSARRPRPPNRRGGLLLRRRRPGSVHRSRAELPSCGGRLQPRSVLAHRPKAQLGLMAPCAGGKRRGCWIRRGPCGRDVAASGPPRGRWRRRSRLWPAKAPPLWAVLFGVPPLQRRCRERLFFDAHSRRFDGFAIIELQDRRLSSLILMVVNVVFVLVSSIAFFWRDPMHLLLTYAIPVLPAIMLFDGCVSAPTHARIPRGRGSGRRRFGDERCGHGGRP